MKPLLYFFLLGFISLSCKKEDSTNSVPQTNTQLVSRNWVARTVTSNGTPYTIKVGEKWFFTNAGTYTRIDQSGTSFFQGTWEFQKMETEILLDKNNPEQKVMTIISLDKSIFRFRLVESGFSLEYTLIPN